VAQLLWGKVYFHDDFAGILREEPNQTISFTYDTDYLHHNKPKIAHSLLVFMDYPHFLIILFQKGG
jgi:HipA-like protein